MLNLNQLNIMKRFIKIKSQVSISWNHTWDESMDWLFYLNIMGKTGRFIFIWPRVKKRL